MQLPQTISGAFPFCISPRGRIEPARDDEALRGRILQTLFTNPGERVNLPEFGCGLMQLVFDPLDDLLAAAVEFSAMQALVRWMGDEIRVDGVRVQRTDETLVIEVAYTSHLEARSQLARYRFK